ncbi:hypothetical protein SLA2020_219300 [Shorea laevis]
MFFLHPCYVFFSLFLFLPVSSSLPSTPLALPLLQFLHSLPKTSQQILSWNQSSSSPCQWEGVSCYSGDTFRVKAFNFSGFQLPGVLNDSVSYLCLHQGLRSLDLSGNNFTGIIPPVLGDCGQLDTILLNDNALHGSILPELFTSKRLKGLDLGLNSLSGEIPPEVSLCKNLEYLGLYNNFLSGEVPTGIFSLPILKTLYLNTNNLTGSLPDFPPYCAISDFWIHENEFSGSLPRSLRHCRNLTAFAASHNGFGGVIPLEIFARLSELEILYLDENNLEGEIPATLWGLEKLQELVLSGNRLSGTISERIGRCNHLVALALSGNNLTGIIPTSIANLTALNFMILFDNMLHGSLPPELGNCSLLVELRLQNNFIKGSIPSEICNLENLEVLYLFNNQFEGLIPHEIGKMSSLEELALYDNNLTGRIPSDIARLKQLTYLSLAHNGLTGALPSELGKYSPGLFKLDLSGNHLVGQIPPGIFSGNNLSVLILGDNRFNESFPADIGKSYSLRRVRLNNNLLQGNIPVDMGKDSGIVFMDIQRNLLEGAIPAVFGHWTNLSMLDLSENRLTGSIPSELGNLKNLQMLRVSSNGLTGSIPSELGSCRKVLKLDLSKNYLSGSIPSEIISLPELQSLLLQENRLSGSIPDSFSPLQNLFELQLGSNVLQGPIPCSLSNLHHFSSVLNLSNNRLSGDIPACLGKLDKLQILDLSSNNFSGEVPTELNNMISLDFVNISFNHLKGELPTTWMKMLASYTGSFLGNPGLCLLCDETASCHKRREGQTSPRIVAGMITGVVLSVVLLCVVIYVLVVRALQPKRYSVLHECQSRTEDLPNDLKIEDIIRATEGWSEKYVIGRGKHGTVYRTEGSSRKDWAVKRVNLSEANFSLEMKTLSMIRHRNILRMAGYSIRDGYGYLVTEYMPGGTVFDVLHQGEPQVVLDWKTRYQIACGIAQGLSYLHHDCVPQIIHRDIKSDNILLDSEFEPKIGDFGMAKLVSSSDSTSTMSAIVGTLGYIAPENAFSTQLTEKCDVYSYGVILLEILCRKLPVDPCFGESLDIVSWCRGKLQENEESICFLDKEISLWENNEQQKALDLLELAVQCTQIVADRRPSMRDVVAYLIKLNDKHDRTKKQTNSIEASAGFN